MQKSDDTFMVDEPGLYVGDANLLNQRIKSNPDGSLICDYGQELNPEYWFANE